MRKVLVSGMSCQSCVNHIEKAFLAKDAKAKVEVNLAKAQVLAETKLSDSEIKELIEEEGYEVKGIESLS